MTQFTAPSGSVRSLLAKANAVIGGSHIVYTSGKHGEEYVNKDAIYVHPLITSTMCHELALRFMKDRVEVVAVPAVGGISLLQGIAHHLTRFNQDEFGGEEVLAVYAEKVRESVGKAATETKKFSFSSRPALDLEPGCELFVEHPRFEFKRGQEKIVPGRRVLVVEDILNTGGSARSVVDAVRALDGIVVGVAAICNRGGVTTADLGNVPKLDALLSLTMQAWDEKDCPLCKRGVPINTQVGKGKAFLARKEQEMQATATAGATHHPGGDVEEDGA